VARWAAGRETSSGSLHMLRAACCWLPGARQHIPALQECHSGWTHTALLAVHCPHPQDMPAKYIYEPWTAPLSVQQAAGCIVGKDYPRWAGRQAAAGCGGGWCIG